MIPKDLLLADGVVDGLVELQATDGKTNTELEEPMGLSESTVRSRMDRLNDADLVKQDADLRDGNAVKVHQLTPEGDKLAQFLRKIIDGYEPAGARETFTSMTPGEVSVEDDPDPKKVDDPETLEEENDMSEPETADEGEFERPKGVTFGNE